MKRIHLIDVAEPLTVFCNLEMRCGETVNNAEVKFMAAEDVAYGLSLPMSTCRKCRDIEPECIPGVPYYVYGLVEKDLKSSEVKFERKEDSAGT